MVPPRVLFIDDEQDIRTVAEISLADVAGWSVSLAGSGAQGLSLAVASPPDVILLDVMMPGLDGPATMAALGEHAGTRHVPVIFITAKLQNAEIERLMSIGAIGVIHKPFDPIELPGEIERLLGS